jgi:sigma-B regulation protein RsbU (phosphoserine phosphatase)
VSLPEADPWGDVSSLPVHSAGFLSCVVATPEPKLARGLHLDDDPLLGDELARMGSMAAAPYFDASGPVAWTLIFHPDPDGLTEADLEDAVLKTALIGTMAGSIAAGRDLQRATAWIQSEIDQIADIQRSLLPQEEPDIPGLSFAAHYATFDRAGGDYYDLLPLRQAEGQLALPRYTEDLASPWAIILADASGHGPSAAVVTAMLHSILHTGLTITNGVIGAPPVPVPVERRRRPQPSPAALLEALGQRLFARRIGPGGGLSFVTAFLGIYDPVARTLTYANAGHHPPLLRTRGSREVTRLCPADAPPGTPLGIRDTDGATDSVLHLEDGHTLVLYTDGVVEAPGPGDRTLWGAERLAAAVASGPDDPRALTAHLVRALRAHEAGQRPRDDQTILVLQAV